MGGTTLALGSIDDVFVIDGLERFSCDVASARFAAHQTLMVRGWAANPHSLRPSRRIGLLVDGSPAGIVRSRRQRHDVAYHFAEPNMVPVGFVALVDGRELRVGSHELQIVLDEGAFALPAMSIEVLPRGVLSTEDEHSSRWTFSIESFDDRSVLGNEPLRVEYGLPAIVRGTIGGDEPELPFESYALVDRHEAYPVQITESVARDGCEETAARFLAGFKTKDLELGQHELQFLIAAPGRSLQRGSHAIAFEVVPLCLERFVPIVSPSRMPAAIDWADREPSVASVSAQPRTFARGAVACVRGWALDLALGESPSSVFVDFPTGVRFRMETRGTRPDVARARAMPAAVYCGFVGGISTHALPHGYNVGRCYIVSKDGMHAYETDAAVEIIVAD